MPIKESASVNYSVATLRRLVTIQERLDMVYCALYVAILVIFIALMCALYVVREDILNEIKGSKP